MMRPDRPVHHLVPGLLLYAEQKREAFFNILQLLVFMFLFALCSESPLQWQGAEKCRTRAIESQSETLVGIKSWWASEKNYLSKSTGLFKLWPDYFLYSLLFLKHMQQVGKSYTKPLTFLPAPFSLVFKSRWLTFSVGLLWKKVCWRLHSTSSCSLYLWLATQTLKPEGRVSLSPRQDEKIQCSLIVNLKVHFCTQTWFDM